MDVLTFGHGTADPGTIIDLLRGAAVEQVVDIRTAPGSRHNPHVARVAITRWLADASIGYRWDKRLGGWRKAPADSPDTALRNRSFCGYAAHMRSAPFLAGVEDLLTEAKNRRLAVMCAESMWWRCHRKLVADFIVLARGWEVRHLMPDGRALPHRPSPEARLDADSGGLVYDAGQETLHR